MQTFVFNISCILHLIPFSFFPDAHTPKTPPWSFPLAFLLNWPSYTKHFWWVPLSHPPHAEPRFCFGWSSHLTPKPHQGLFLKFSPWFSFRLPVRLSPHTGFLFLLRSLPSLLCQSFDVYAVYPSRLHSPNSPHPTFQSHHFPPFTYLFSPKFFSFFSLLLFFLAGRALWRVMSLCFTVLILHPFQFF